MPSRSAHGREPEPLDEILDCLAYIQAVYSGNDESAQAAFDILRQRLEGRADAMVPPLKLASLIVDEAGKRGCDISAVLAGVRDQALAERDHRNALSPGTVHRGLPELGGCPKPGPIIAARLAARMRVTFVRRRKKPHRT